MGAGSKAHQSICSINYSLLPWEGGILFSNEILSVKMLGSGRGEERLTTFRLQGLSAVPSILQYIWLSYWACTTSADVTCWGWESASWCCCCCSAGGCPPRSGRRWYRSGTPGERREEPIPWSEGPCTTSAFSTCVVPRGPCAASSGEGHKLYSLERKHAVLDGKMLCRAPWSPIFFIEISAFRFVELKAENELTEILSQLTSGEEEWGKNTEPTIWSSAFYFQWFISFLASRVVCGIDRTKLLTLKSSQASLHLPTITYHFFWKKQWKRAQQKLSCIDRGWLWAINN